MRIFDGLNKLEVIEVRQTLRWGLELTIKNKENGDINYVNIIKKKGRTEIYCTCHNGTIYQKYPALCRHKIKAINYLSERKIPKNL